MRGKRPKLQAGEISVYYKPTFNHPQLGLCEQEKKAIFSLLSLVFDLGKTTPVEIINYCQKYEGVKR